MWQIPLEICSALSMTFIGLKPKTSLHKHLTQCVIVAPATFLKVANSSESFVGCISVILRAAFGKRGSVFRLERTTIWGITYDDYRLIPWEIFRDIDTQSVVFSVVCDALPFHLSIASRCCV